MANNLSTTTERERVYNRDLDTPLRNDLPRSTSRVNVYDRPATTGLTTRPRSNNMFASILIIIVLLVLAYFVFQWLF